MAQPVVFAPQYTSPYQQTIMPSMMNLLTGLALAKVQHKWNLESAESQAKIASIQKQEEMATQSAYKMAEQAAAPYTLKPGEVGKVGPETIAQGGEALPYKIGEVKDFKVGNELIQHEYVGPGKGTNGSAWQATGVTAPRYKPGNVTVNTGSRPMTKMGEEMATALVAERKDVEGAVSSLNNIKELRGLLSGGMITGTGAEFLTGMGNFLASRLGFKEFEDPVANTQAFAAAAGRQVGQIIKQFGAGTGLSDADREYAEKIVAGKITLNEQAIKKLLAINEKAFTNVITNYNKKANQVMKKPGAQDLPYDLRIDVNAMKPVSQMSDEELLMELTK